MEASRQIEADRRNARKSTGPIMERQAALACNAISKRR
jgi:hypothetical protein